MEASGDPEVCPVEYRIYALKMWFVRQRKEFGELLGDFWQTSGKLDH